MKAKSQYTQSCKITELLKCLKLVVPQKSVFTFMGILKCPSSLLPPSALPPAPVSTRAPSLFSSFRKAPRWS